MFTKAVALPLSVVFAITMILCMAPQSIHSVATEAEQDMDANVWMEKSTGNTCMEVWWFGAKHPNTTNSHWTTYHASGEDHPSHPYPHLQHLTFTIGNVTILLVDYC